jgi:3-methyladenine DNA glycosylase AlkD
MKPATALAALEAHGDPARARGMAAYHKTPRRYFGTPVPDIAVLARGWQHLPPEDQIALAEALWASDIHEARIAAAKLFERRRVPAVAAVWRVIRGWVPDFDGWAIADHVCKAGSLRLLADPARIDTVAGWTESASIWTRRAALVITLPWARVADPLPFDTATRERVLGWAAGYLDENDWFIHKAVGWWLRDLSKRDPDRVRDFLARHGAAMRPFARREAEKYLAG